MPSGATRARTTAAIVREYRNPKRVLLKMSLPSSSVPNRWLQLGGWKRVSRLTYKPALFGSGAMNGANSAIAMDATAMISPTMDRGLLENLNHLRFRSNLRESCFSLLSKSTFNLLSPLHQSDSWIKIGNDDIRDDVYHSVHYAYY